MSDDNSHEGKGPITAHVHVTEIMSSLEAALEYARHGLHVFPCNPLHKAPLVGSEWANGTRIERSGGLYQATTDESKIRVWWTNWPLAMVGIRTGEVSGIWAIDPDVPKAVDAPDGVQNWNELQELYGEAPPTQMHSTPTGGLHFVFKYRPDKPVGCSEGELHGLGINVRGNGGYIIAPPSMNAEGGRYEIAVPDHKFMFADAPEWLYDMILSECAPALPEIRIDGPAEARHHYGEAALRDEVAKLSAMSPETGRNIALNRAAFSLGQLVASG